MSKMKRVWFLIENNSQQVFEFQTLKQLREFAKKEGYKIKKSPTSEHTFYTESYVILPTGEID